jgi:hypothetical protein
MTTQYWKKIKQIRRLVTYSSYNKKIKNLFYNSQVISTGSMKAQVFGQVLHETFTDHDANPNFNSKHKEEVENYIKRESNTLFSKRPEDADFDLEFSMTDLDSCMESLKKRSAPGPDGIKNNQILHLPHVGEFLLLRIANASWNYNCIIENWKISQLTMIDKKTDDRANQELSTNQSH